MTLAIPRAAVLLRRKSCEIDCVKKYLKLRRKYRKLRLKKPVENICIDVCAERIRSLHGDKLRR